MPTLGQAELTNLRVMRDKIDEIDRLSSELKALGDDLPVVKKNAATLLNITRLLKFGISDMVETFED